MLGGRINRPSAQGWQARTARFARRLSLTYSSSPIFTSPREHGRELLQDSCWSLLPTGAGLAEAWLFLLGHVTTADSCLLS